MVTPAAVPTPITALFGMNVRTLPVATAVSALAPSIWPTRNAPHVPTMACKKWVAGTGRSTGAAAAA